KPLPRTPQRIAMNEETLFHEVLARSTPQERDAFLAEACAGRPELRAAVEALLAAHEQPGDFLSSPGIAVSPAQDTENHAARPDPESRPGSPDTVDVEASPSPGDEGGGTGGSGASAAAVMPKGQLP